ncbi:MAG: phosphonate ABC transporter, permease protein PhnE [Acidimicrobiales bacterium]
MLTAVAVVAFLVVFTIWSAKQVNFSFSVIWTMPSNALWEKAFPPNWSFLNDKVWAAFIETFRIAILATFFGCLIAIPISFWMSRLTAPNNYVYYVSKSIMNVVRTIPDLFWAKILVVAVGIALGALAGTIALTIFSISVMVKLFSETIDAADPGALEAAQATGAKHTPAVRVGVFPEVLPNYVAYALYIFELNIRASLVLGLVGAGGIGQIIDTQKSFFGWANIMAIVAVMFVVVLILEQISVVLRRRLV